MERRWPRDTDPVHTEHPQSSTTGEHSVNELTASESDSEPYSDTVEHLLEELDRLDLVLRVHLKAWLAANDGDVDPYRGLYISDEQVGRALSSDDRRYPDTNLQDAPDNPTNYGFDDRDNLAARIGTLAATIRSRAQQTIEAGTELRLLELADRFDLTPAHLDALLLGLAPELDAAYEIVYSYLHDDVTRRKPTVGLVLDVLYNSAVTRLEGRSAFSWQSPLRANELIRLSDDADSTLLSRTISVDDRVVAYLLGDDTMDERLRDVCTAETPELPLDDLFVDERRRETLDQLAQRLAAGPSRPTFTHLRGPYGSGAETAVRALCGECDLPVVKLDGSTLGERDVCRTVRLVVREARLRNAAVHVTGIDWLISDSATLLEDVCSTLDDFNGPVFLTGEQSLPLRTQIGLDGHAFETLLFPVPSYDLRRERWAAAESLASDVDVAALASKFRLTPGQIDDALAMARRFANGEEITRDAIYRACRAQSTERFGSLVQQRTPHYAWEDIVLPPDTLAHLREVAAQITHRGTVYADWGFDQQFSLGNGLTVLFTGASGTGKTMAADIIAGEAGLDLYKIDLAGVVNKYIGETEKNLERVFDEAETSDAILLFDEADALFGKRSEVSDAHDRYANVQVNYLLQRIEEHDGTVVLTTNFKENLDEAFLRRINLSVDFPRPDEDLRAEIWRRTFPEETPVGDIDYEFLSTFDVTGGNIKNVAVTAAFMAADDGAAVEMGHVVRAMRREFQKTGKLVAPDDFGEYAGPLPQ